MKNCSTRPRRCQTWPVKNITKVAAAVITCFFQLGGHATIEIARKSGRMKNSLLQIHHGSTLLGAFTVLESVELWNCATKVVPLATGFLLKHFFCFECASLWGKPLKPFILRLEGFNAVENSSKCSELLRTLRGASQMLRFWAVHLLSSASLNHSKPKVNSTSKRGIDGPKLVIFVQDLQAESMCVDV